jgi:PIN domain nuclease of toxin-antitoxin system
MLSFGLYPAQTNLRKLPESFIEDGNNEIFISIASLWEISIKHALGKLKINGEFEGIISDLESNNIQVLPLNFTHILWQNKLPFHHRDPFDRIIVSQAITENLGIISADTILDNYIETSLTKRFW